MVCYYISAEIFRNHPKGNICYHIFPEVIMTKKQNILLRDVPQSIYTWIESQRQTRRVSQKEFLLKILETASTYNVSDTLFPFTPAVSFRRPTDTPFTFIDLFAGIGGMHIGLEKAGGECVFACEWDKHSQKTYTAWFGMCPHGDIKKIAPEDIPDHNILAAGFPCQPFSIAGVSKKQSMGRLHGFQDVKQGNLFFDIAKIVEVKRPQALILENVKNLLSHDKGRTWTVIKTTLEDLGYKVFHKIIDAKDYVPQHRERIFIVAFDTKVFGDNIPFEYPTPPAGRKPRLSDILEKNCDPRYTLSDHLWSYLQKYAQKHKEKGNGFGFGLASPDSNSRTLSARYHKDGSEILIPQKGRNPRRLTPKECIKLMGFPKELPIVVSDTQAYRQFGNALVPPIAESVANQVVKVFQWAEKNKKMTLPKPAKKNAVAEARKEKYHVTAGAR